MGIRKFILLVTLCAAPATALADGFNGAVDGSCANLGGTFQPPPIITNVVSEVPNPAFDPNGSPTGGPPVPPTITITTQVVTPQAPIALFGTQEVLACHKQLVNRESLIHLNHHVQDQLVNRLLGGGSVEPAGLSLDQKSARERLKRGGIEVIPTADLEAAPAIARNWNTWIDGKFSFIETNEAIGDSDGGLFNGLMGADYKLTDKFTLGLIANYESSDLDTAAAPPQTTKTEGLGGGVYAGLVVGDSIVLSATATGTAIDTDVAAGGVTADIDSARLQLSGGATGYYYFGQTRLTPLVNIAYSKEWQDAYTDSGGAAAAAQTFESGVFTAGGQIGHTFAGQGNMSIEPWLGAQIDWTFLDKAKTKGAATLKADDTIDLRIQGGFNISFAENAQLAIMGEASGLLLDDSDIYAVDAVLSFQF